MPKPYPSRGPAPHEVTRYAQPPRRDFRPRPGPVAPERHLLASALRVRNLKALVEAGSEENMAIALDVPLQRVKELLEGVNFSDEIAFHIEDSLSLSTGFFDQVNPKLTEEVLKRLKSPTENLPAVEPLNTPASSPPSETPQETTVPRIAKSAPSPAAPAAAAPVPPVAAPPAAAPAPVGFDDAEEAKLREVRRNNLMLITSMPGAKSQLARLVGMSPANISHRLHGNKHFDEETAQFFAEKLGFEPGWFNQVHGEGDVPAEVTSLLSTAGGRGKGRGKDTKTRGPRKPRVLKAGAPSAANAPAGGVLLRSAVLSTGAADTGAVPAEPAAAPAAPAALPSAPAAVGAPLPTRARSTLTTTRAAGPAKAPATASAAVLAPAAADHSVVDSPITAILSSGHSLGPIAEALVKTLALKARQGSLDEARALRILTDIMAL